MANIKEFSSLKIINKLIGDISEENFNTYKIEEQKILDKSIEGRNKILLWGKGIKIV